MFWVMWQLEPTLTLLALGVAPFLLVTIKVFGKPMGDRSRERRELEGHMMAVVQRALSAVPLVQAFAREETEHARFQTYANATVGAYRRSIAADMWFKLAVGAVTSVGTAGMMYLGAWYG